ncbi:MAG TPA: UDP-glucose/GDP-mannose dehydrogenase family protein [Pseudolabrys sp.]|nr:UDP-glucose/GDP-mannose dehydrogenase family protein [Pseudolabrys sp.]
MKLTVIGTGYVGLVSGVCLAEIGVDVVCVDSDAGKIERIRKGETPIHENGLESLLAKHIGRRLTATTAAEAALLDSSVSMIAVGTPFDGERIDLSQVEAAARKIGEVLRTRDDYHVVVVKSTVIAGTTAGPVREILEAVSGKRAGIDFGLAMNPEFLREGAAVADFMNPDRIVIGGIDGRSIATVRKLYRPFIERGVPIFETNCDTAEMIKYTNNALFATMISFSNEIGNLCARLPGVDVLDVMAGVHLDKRLSPRLATGETIRPRMLEYLAAGCGFGGSCFPKDVKALAAHARALALEPRMLDSLIEVNRTQFLELVRQLERHIPVLAGSRIAVLGLAFKPESDDIRESPAISLIEALIARGCSISAFDPLAAAGFRRKFPNWPVRYGNSVEATIEHAEAVVIVTRWKEFGRLPALVAGMVTQPLIVDGRRMFRPGDFPRYAGIGVETNDSNISVHPNIKVAGLTP